MSGGIPHRAFGPRLASSSSQTLTAGIDWRRPAVARSRSGALLHERQLDPEEQPRSPTARSSHGRAGDTSRQHPWPWLLRGFCLFAKRSEKGRFTWPNTRQGAVTLTPAQMSMLLGRLEWRAPQKTWAPTVAGKVTTATKSFCSAGSETDRSEPCRSCPISSPTTSPS